MANQVADTLLMLPPNGRRLVLFPLPFQGHINPMLQLANILHTRGFKITIIHTEVNSPNSSNYPHFTFRSFPDGILKLSNFQDPIEYLFYLNESCDQPLRACLGELMAESDKEPVLGFISDAVWYITQKVANDLKIPRLALWTSGPSSVHIYDVLPLFLENGLFKIPKEEEEATVPGFPLLRVKDIVKMNQQPESISKLGHFMIEGMKPALGIIWNTFKELEQPVLEALLKEFPVPNFTIGPFHKYFLASSSSLLDQDRSIIPWLDSQSPKSVIYASLGSVSVISETELQEMAHGLADSGFPFVWAVRPDIVLGSEWLETLPENFLEEVGNRGQIVKWAPQQEVLAHPATGCFWTHNGWNSTLESICEGVPMICLPCFVDQPINARYVTDEWKIGLMLENGFERVEIVKAIERVMAGIEGEEIRERIDRLKQKVKLALNKGGSSHQSLENLVKYLLSL